MPPITAKGQFQGRDSNTPSARPRKLASRLLRDVIRIIMKSIARNSIVRAPFVGVAGIIALCFITGCGGGNGFDLNRVTVTVSPAAVTIPASGQVTLQATVTGVPGGPVVSSWTIAELKINGASGAQCNWLGTTPPAGPCPDGTIQGADASPALTVTYHAPSTSGTFHVIAEWSTAFNPVITKDGTSVITVGP